MTRARRFLSIARSLSLGLSCLGCAGVSRVADLPPDAGIPARYHEPVGDVAEALPAALASVGQSEAEGGNVESASIVVLGIKSMSLNAWGEVSRSRVTPLTEGGAELRVVTRPRYLLDVWPATAQSLKVISAVDRRLGPRAIALVDGDRVRGQGSPDRTVEGVVLAGDGGPALFRPMDDASEPVPLERMSELEVFRGSYGHAKTGATVGLAVGLVAWAATCYENVFPATRSTSCDLFVLPVLGGLAGGLLGTAIRTSVWSPVDASPGG